MKHLVRITLVMVLIAVSCMAQKRTDAVYVVAGEVPRAGVVEAMPTVGNEGVATDDERIMNIRNSDRPVFNVYASVALPFGEAFEKNYFNPVSVSNSDIFSSFLGLGVRARWGAENRMRYGCQVAVSRFLGKRHTEYFDGSEYIYRGGSGYVVSAGPGFQYDLSEEAAESMPYLDVEVPNLVVYFAGGDPQYRVSACVGVGYVVSKIANVGLDLSAYYHYDTGMFWSDDSMQFLTMKLGVTF